MNRNSPHSKQNRSKPTRRTGQSPNASAPKNKEVQVREDTLCLPTYLPDAPDKNPMFLERRVYQGSSGRIYPLPFTDRIAEKPINREWQAIWIENEFLRVLLLPEIGGRIHAIQDKLTGYDLIYNQHVIKPALVGLAGPWVSGGIEFNWPQHHRPATFLPTDYQIERHADGSVTVWCSDHDPLCRMKGMHGVCLHPGRAYVELKVRAYNRTPFVQTFLWWANVATRVHEAYQSFFPPDVTFVADHARRSMSEYPLAQGSYYGVNYGERGRDGVPAGEVPAQYVPPHCRKEKAPGMPNYAPNDLSFYANIPTPCSYMCMGSQEDFFGGYDFKAQEGIVHVANHHISPGKKQWTWGNHEFGYAWDRNLTDRDHNGEFAPYIEIMAGVYTDNQPDFSFLQPGEVKAWSQYWYPIQKIGPAQHANLDAALSLALLGKNRVRLGIAATRLIDGAKVQLLVKGEPVFSKSCKLIPGQPLIEQIKISRRFVENDLRVRITDGERREIFSYQPKPRETKGVPPAATEPPPPVEIASADELFVTGLHLEQYRHATRCPTLYWGEALRRDPHDARCNLAMGRWHLRRGEFTKAEPFFQKAIERLTRRNANPYDGEPHYYLGLCFRFLGREKEAYDALYKSTWNQAWAGAAYHALAEMDCARGDWTTALAHCQESARCGRENHRLLNLWALVLRRSGDPEFADRLLQANRTADPLDWWTRHLMGEPLQCDLQTRLDIAHDYARAGFWSEAIVVLQYDEFETGDLPDQSWGARPMVHYTRGWLEKQLGRHKQASAQFRKAAALPRDYCFPARLEEIAVLELAMRVQPEDAAAPYYLGNLFYDRQRYTEAISLWERSAELDPNYSVVWRNLGIGYFNVYQNSAKARAAYDRAIAANPRDARLIYERDQLWKRLGESPNNRLRELEKNRQLVQKRDDLSVELCALYNQTGAHEKALALVSSRKFQPWEGGEGGPYGQWVRSHLMLGKRALRNNQRGLALEHFQAALRAPENLGEARHLLANQSDVHYWCGCALSDLGENSRAREEWLMAASFKGDFQEMSVRAFSEMTYYSAFAYAKLGQTTEARQLLEELAAYATKLASALARIDYFATSLPTMLLFNDDLQFRQQTTALVLQAQAHLGLGENEAARNCLSQALARDPNHAIAADLWAEPDGVPHKFPVQGERKVLVPAIGSDGNGRSGELTLKPLNGGRVDLRSKPRENPETPV